MPKLGTKEIKKIPKSLQEQNRQNIVKDYFSEGLIVTQLADKYDKKKPSITRIFQRYRAKKTTKRKKGSGGSQAITKSKKNYSQYLKE